VIRAGYELDCDHLWAARASSKEIKEDNFSNHLGEGE
jgi:hypothetical protein